MEPSLACVIRVPQEANIPSSSLQLLCRRFRTSRLIALKTDPSSFSSSYTRECEFDDTVWLQRLQNPVAQTFVALIPKPNGNQDRSIESGSKNGDIADDIRDDLVLLLENEWLGMVVMIGPKHLATDGFVSPTLWELFSSLGPSATPDALIIGRKVAYLAVSMFDLPEVRRQGLGRKLIVESLKIVKRDCMAAGVSTMNIGLLVASGNAPAIELYHSCGFKMLPEADEGAHETASKTIGMAHVTRISAE